MVLKVIGAVGILASILLALKLQEAQQEREFWRVAAMAQKQDYVNFEVIRDEADKPSVAFFYSPYNLQVH